MPKKVIVELTKDELDKVVLTKLQDMLKQVLDELRKEARDIFEKFYRDFLNDHRHEVIERAASAICDRHEVIERAASAICDRLFWEQTDSSLFRAEIIAAATENIEIRVATTPDSEDVLAFH